MQQPLQITFRGITSSAALEQRVRALADRLERFHDRITSCHVTIQAPHQHHPQGAPFDIHLRIGIPSGEINITKTSAKDCEHDGPYVALRDAFHAATRRLDGEQRRHEHRA